ncbi:hypothetical protein QP735_04150 [Curtobacterium citreum]|uniref:hypothetical protein n=1 Tax=Curtobacterium citreum TaxID=2036 RepID=UPI00254F39EE|nr:hypothetical protein [Curtobacterium citreum]MDK8171715.1 hypothetical protein [Curtobacterium citreum]
MKQEGHALSITQTSNAVARQKQTGTITVNDGSLANLLDWVVNTATPEQVAWSATEFIDMRDWLKAHKAAKDLRAKATRLEMIALRKVGIAGLSRKLTRYQKNVADWLAGMTNEQFNAVLADITGAETPVGLMRKADAEEKQMRSRVRSLAILDGQVDTGYEAYRPYGLNESVKTILEEMSTVGEPFEVADAANALAKRWSLANEEEVPEALRGEPLREVVRRALREGAMGGDAYTDAAGERVRAPQFVTYSEAGDSSYVRVPWATASVAQFRFQVGLKMQQANAMYERAMQSQRLLDAIDRQFGDDADEQRCAEALDSLVSAHALEVDSAA